MKKSVVLFVILIPICVSSWMLFGQHFVVKKKKRVSVTTLREQCCQELGSLLQRLPGLIKTIADIQEKTITKVYAYLDGDKAGFWSRSKESTEQSLARIQAFEQRITTMEQQLHELSAFFNALDQADAKHNRAANSPKTG